MGDLSNYLLAGMKAVLKKDTLPSDVSPTEAQCVAACNAAVRDMVERFAFREFHEGDRSSGRMDLLIRQQIYEEETGSAGFCEWPNNTHTPTPGIIVYLVEVGGVPAVKVDLEDIKLLAFGMFAVTSTRPVYAEGNNGGTPVYDGIYYLPASATVIGYHFVQVLTLLEVGVTEDWPLDDDLMPLALFKALAIICAAAEEAATRRIGALFGSWYETMMGILLNPLGEMAGEEVV